MKARIDELLSDEAAKRLYEKLAEAEEVLRDSEKLAEEMEKRVEENEDPGE